MLDQKLTGDFPTDVRQKYRPPFRYVLRKCRFTISGTCTEFIAKSGAAAP